MIRQWLVLLFWFGQIIAIGQSQMVDSLMAVVSRNVRDTNTVNAYRMLSGILSSVDPVKGIRYGIAGVSLSKSIEWDKGTAGCLLNLSVNYVMKEQLDTALIYVNQAIEYAHKVGDPNRLGLVYLNRGDLYMKKQDFKHALEDCEVALEYAEASNNDDRRARILQTIGSVNFYQQQYPKALDYYTKALVLYEQLGNDRMAAIVYNNNGNIYKRLKDFQKAEQSFLKAILLGQELDDKVNLSMYHGNIADVYLEENQISKAEKAANQALQYARDIDIITQEGISLEIIARVLLKKGEWSNAIEKAEQAKAIAVENEDINTVINATNLLAEAYIQTGQATEAYENLKLAKRLNDSIIHLQFNEDISAMQAKFDVDSKDKEIKILAQEATINDEKLGRQRLWLALLSLLVLTVGVAAFNYINRVKLNKKLQEMELRSKIAADLHDEVGSSLSSIHLLSAMAHNKEKEAGQKKLMESVSTNAKETIEKMSDIVWLIKPVENDGESLKTRMEKYAFDMRDGGTFQLKTDLEVLRRIELSMDQRSNLYLIFKEALNNAAKYSNAKLIEVKAFSENKKLNLSIKDDGDGFEYHSSNEGNGLNNMRKRAEDINAFFDIQSVVGQGTTINLEVTLKNHPSSL